MDMCYKPLETCLKYRATEGCMTLPPLIVAVQVNLCYNYGWDVS